MKITVLDGFGLNPGDLSWDSLALLGDLTVYDRTSPSELIKRAQGSNILLTNKTVIDADAITRLPDLRYIGVLATGYNVVDIEEALKRGIVVTNIPAYSTMSVAQQVFAFLLAVTNKVEHYTTEVREGKWTRCPDFCFWDTPLMEIAGKTFGIIGLGNIGKAVGKIALAFDMNVIAKTSKTQDFLPSGIKKVEYADLFSKSDIISLHCPLTDKNKELINRDTISQMKDEVIIINTGRGGLIDENAVAEGLKSGKIKAFCADVLSTEPPGSNNPLLEAPNVFLTPHIAWATKEARNRLMEISLNNLKAFIAGNPCNQVNC